MQHPSVEMTVGSSKSQILRVWSWLHPVAFPDRLRPSRVLGV